MGTMRPTRRDAEAVLRREGWLSLQPKPFQDDVLARCRLLFFAANEPIYRVGDPPGGLYGLVSGNALVQSSPPYSSLQMIKVGTPGMWTGEGAFLTRQPRRIELRAREATWVMHLPLEQMDRMVAADPMVLRAFCLLLVGTLDVLLQMVSGLQMNDPFRRIAAAIDRSLPRSETELTVSQTDLAEMSRTTRKQVGPALKLLADARIVDPSYRKLRILDRERLRRFAWDE
ncbi:MAG: Crp/Fnr family transcriptional regulator [Sphingomonas sp.]|nr:MAG: Crp/Fnr family transcriptional regulator [Sphingomonas sp.]